MRLSGLRNKGWTRFAGKKTVIAAISTVLAFGIITGYLMTPALGETAEVLGGNGGLDDSAQVSAWNLVNTDGTSVWEPDTTVFQTGTGSGRLESPEGSDTAFASYVYYRFTTAKVPTGATLDLAYRKLYAGAQPAAGNWNVTAELWEVGGTAPLESINIDTGTTNADFTAIPTQNLTGITKMNTQYELRLVQKGQTGTDPAGKLTTWFDDVLLNVTYDSTPPKLVSAIAPTDRSVDLVFDEKVDPVTAEAADNYSVGPTLNVTGAALQADGKTVRLTTDVQTRGTNYTVTANKVQDISGNAMTTDGTATFSGVDTSAPAVDAVKPVTDKTIDVKFSEQVDKDTAEMAVNYAVSPTLQVTGAVLQADQQTVRLNTSVQTLGTTYTVTANNIMDTAGNTIINSNTADFTGIDTTAPEVVSAATINDTTVSVVFNEEVAAANAENPDNYSISPALAVSKAVLQPDNKTVHLTTEKQAWQADYTVTVHSLSDVSGNVMVQNGTAAFSGIDTTPPEVVSAKPVDDMTVDVLFNEAVDSASAQTISNYSITPGLAVHGAVLQADGRTVRITTEKQALNVIYTVTVTGVTDLAGNIVGSRNTASVTGVDTTAPVLSSASALTYKTVNVVFSEKVDPAAAEVPGNYSVTPGLAVTGAVLQSDGVTVKLVTENQVGGTAYTVVADGIKDIAGNTIAGNNAAGFTGIAPPVVNSPKVLSASAPDNTSISLVFSTTVDPVTAQEAANYSISPELAVTGAILQGDGVTVKLSTATQTSGTVYIVSVTNVKDLYGNVIGTTNNTAAFTGSATLNDNPHGKYLDDTNQCSLCHVTHNGQGANLLSQPTQTQMCYLCHDAGGQSQYDVADQFGQTAPYAPSHHKVPEGSQQCTDCHNPHDGGKDATGNDIHWPALLQSSADKTKNGGNDFCFSCHQNAQGVTKPINSATYPADGVGHNNSSFILNGTTPFNPASGTNIRCMGCHESHGSEQVKLLRGSIGGDSTVSGNDRSLCLKCHSGPTADNRFPGQTVYDNPAVNPHSLTSSTNTNIVYPGVNASQAGQCVNCHDPHGSQNGTSKVSMKTVRGTYNDDKTSYSAADFGFCFGCHNNTSANTKYDIQSMYNAPSGGHRIKTNGGNLAVGSALQCEDCHSLHGSANNNKYMLNDSLGSNLGDGRNECLACHKSGKTVEGIAMSAPAAAVPEHTGTTTPCLACHGSPHLLTSN